MNDKKSKIEEMIKNAMYELAEQLDCSGVGRETILEETGYGIIDDYFDELLEDVYNELDNLN